MFDAYATVSSRVFRIVTSEEVERDFNDWVAYQFVPRFTESALSLPAEQVTDDAFMERYLEEQMTALIARIPDLFVVWLSEREGCFIECSSMKRSVKHVQEHFKTHCLEQVKKHLQEA